MELFLLLSLLVVLVGARFWLSETTGEKNSLQIPKKTGTRSRDRGDTGCTKCPACLLETGVSQITGTKELQADCVQVFQNDAGVMAVMADGIGRSNTGKVSAQIAADTVLDQYESYHVLNNPEYFFRTVFHEAHLRIQRTIGERRGGSCLAAVFLNGKEAFYALAGDIRIALLRNAELIPISRGHTMDVLAAVSWQEGKMSRKEALWSQEKKNVWNYLGMDGFRQVEMGELPVRLKTGDVIVLANRGIWQELSMGELEDLLLAGGGLQRCADRIAYAAEQADSGEKENGSILLIRAEVTNETDQL